MNQSYWSDAGGDQATSFTLLRAESTDEKVCTFFLEDLFFPKEDSAAVTGGTISTTAVSAGAFSIFGFAAAFTLDCFGGAFVPPPASNFPGFCVFCCHGSEIISNGRRQDGDDDGRKEDDAGGNLGSSGGFGGRLCILEK